ncbi:MAG: hypothetical protein C4525_05025 [Desulfarculus sp.]|nr:MAG: hypothetical protein C4525_05025 [Desulfarculus sp.]
MGGPAAKIILPAPEVLRGQRTLIRGEVNTGKTLLLAQALQGLLAAGEEDLAVLDLAPPLTRGVGGKMGGPWPRPVRYYTAELAAPRLSGRTPQEVLSLAQDNARRLEHLFAQYLRHPARVLFINDVSMYLQAGELEELERVLEASRTVVVNGYYGRSLGGGELGERERAQMDALARLCQRVIFTG